MCVALNSSFLSAVITGPDMDVSPGLADLPQAAGDFCRNITEREAVFQPGDVSRGERVDLCPELPDLVQLRRFTASKLRGEEHELTFCKEETRRPTENQYIVQMREDAAFTCRLSPV